MSRPHPLKPSALRRRVARSSLRFRNTAQLEDLDEVIGQPRATEALDFGIAIDQPGFNLFAYGPAETGLRQVVRRALDAHAQGQSVPHDWVYVFNFEDAHKPLAITLPPGRGSAFRGDMEQLVETLGSTIPAAFDSEEYRARVSAFEDEVKAVQQAALKEIEERAKAQHIALINTPVGMGFAPVKGDEVISPEVFAKLPVAERGRITKQIEALQEDLQNAMRELPRLVQGARDKLRDLDREVTAFAVGHLMEALCAKYAELEPVVAHLRRVQQDVIENAALFRPMPKGEDAAPTPADGRASAAQAIGRYRVNLLVDNSRCEGAPVVFEPDPNYQNLVGRVEHQAEMGTLVADFSLVKPGALHRANGGYLIIDARGLLTRPHAWEGLKEALRSHEIRIESLGQIFSMVSTVSLEPEPIPVRVKVVLFGEPMLYYMLRQHDPDFAELFKVAADFDDRMPRNADTSLLYARFIATQARAAGLRPLSRDAVALVIEESARMTDDSERLSTLTREIADLLAEADHWAGRREARLVEVEDMRTALAARLRRTDRIPERMREQIERGTILIETSGAKAGQINGLAVMQLGGFAFGKPSRISARVRMGRGQVIDIEREVKLGGPTHSKGVLILSNFLAARFATDEPLSLAASLVFEQSYGGVDGDSASSTELYALLSALSQVPIAQGIAVTGSVNQFGEVQAIGGANEKIEGFFDLCQARGLTGEQGVLIPAANVKHLMLREDIVEAAAAGQFRVWPVSHVDQGIELLTGIAAGKANRHGSYPAGSINRLVVDRLRDFAEKRRLAAKGGGNTNNKAKNDG
jgi:predicted ATP-dependent protease